MRSNWRGARLVIGTLLALLAGAVVSLLPDWLTQTLGLMNSPQPYVAMGSFTLAGLMAGAGAWLLRSWWSALVVPALFFASYALGALLDLRIMGSPYDPGYMLLGAEVFAVIFFIPLLLVTLLATAISKRLAHGARTVEA